MIERLRADTATAAIPIVVLTSKTMTAADKQRLNGQISYLAHKGEFDRAALVEVVGRLSRAREPRLGGRHGRRADSDRGGQPEEHEAGA